jgi:type IV pilus assembly protein PilM
LALFGSKKQIIGLDIGSNSIRAAVVNVSASSSQLMKYAEERIVNNNLSSGEVLQPMALAETLKKLFKTLKISKGDIVLGLSGSSVMVKKVTIPKIENQMLSDQVRWEAEQYIPFDLSSVNLDYVILGSETSSDSNDILIVAAQKDQIQAIVDVIRSVGSFSVVTVDVNGFALANAFAFNYGRIQGQAVALIDIGAFYSHFVIVQNGDVVFCRDLPVGGILINQEIQSAMDISFDEAERFKLGSDMPEVAAKAIEVSFGTIADQIQGSFEFFINTTQGVNVTNVFLTGGTAYAKGLLKVLQKTLEIPCEYLNPLRNLDINSSVKDVESFQKSGSVVLGLALRSEGDID